MEYLLHENRVVGINFDRLSEEELTVDELVDSPHQGILIRKHGRKDFTFSAMLVGFKTAIKVLTTYHVADVGGFRVIGYEDDLFDRRKLVQDGKFSHVILTTMAAVHYNRLDKQRQSLQVSAYLKRHHGEKEPQKLQLIALMRDWSKGNKYGIECPILREDLEPWPDGSVKFLIESQLNRWREKALCTEEEMWIRPEYWVGKRKFSDYISAGKRSAETGLPVQVDFSSPYRCLNACDVAEHCEQHQVYKQRKVELLNAVEWQKGDVK